MYFYLSKLKRMLTTTTNYPIVTLTSMDGKKFCISKHILSTKSEYFKGILELPNVCNLTIDLMKDDLGNLLRAIVTNTYVKCNNSNAQERLISNCDYYGVYVHKKHQAFILTKEKANTYICVVCDKNLSGHIITYCTKCTLSKYSPPSMDFNYNIEPIQKYCIHRRINVCGKCFSSLEHAMGKQIVIKAISNSHLFRTQNEENNTTD